ncbi:DUF7108 domain-containing protein [Halovivax limisalsi]|uniref:DUF7108 domain-containing protein n=1 Tax=Halovivax limisalsi TaxID=1453760 RepID=UPI001FFCD01A|nr:rnhA operon protein [Halovivax limisalsi]
MTAPAGDDADRPEGDRPDADGSSPERQTAESSSDRATDASSLDRFADEALPADDLRAVERLTRLARRAVDENEREAYETRRASILAEHGYTARIRAEDDTLVCYPTDWLEDGVVRIDRIDETDRAVELSLAGPGDPDDWDALDAANRARVDRVREAYGEPHAENAAIFADFVGNHYAKPIPAATGAEIEEFLAEYYVRNAWPTAAARAAVVQSIEHLFSVCDEPVPDYDVPDRIPSE